MCTERISPIANGSMEPAKDSLQCDEEFILINGTCQAICTKWRIVSKARADAIFALNIILATAAGAFAIILLIFSLKRRKRLYVYGLCDYTS